MNSTNPTPLRLGMTCQLSGQTCRIIGKALMRTTENGSADEWTEFYLEDSKEQIWILVCEKENREQTWKLFAHFKPRIALSPHEASLKKLGDRIMLDAKAFEVSWIDQSRVCSIEGVIPSEMAVGDMDSYFNAKAGEEMLVVSWDQNHVDYYRGRNVPVETIATIFNLPAQTLRSPKGFWNKKRYMMLAVLIVMEIIFAGMIIFRVVPILRHGSTQKLEEPSLMLNVQGTICDQTLHLEACTQVKLASVGMNLEYYEYHLCDPSDQIHLLTYGFDHGKKNWILFKPYHPIQLITPCQAAQKTAGEVLILDDFNLKIQKLFRFKAGTIKPSLVKKMDCWTEFYGFLATHKNETFLIRWNAENIFFFRGIHVSDKDIRSAFETKRKVAPMAKPDDKTGH